MRAPVILFVAAMVYLFLIFEPKKVQEPQSAATTPVSEMFCVPVGDGGICANGQACLMQCTRMERLP